MAVYSRRQRHKPRLTKNFVRAAASFICMCVHTGKFVFCLTTAIEFTNQRLRTPSVLTEGKEQSVFKLLVL